LALFSPWKSRPALRPPSFGGSLLPSFGTKLFMLAQASISVPSTEKCSLDKSLRTSGKFKTPAMNLAATSPPKRRSRFLQNTVASGSSADKPANQRNRRL
jgi:hypothetical protein